jgi:DNA-binding NarL/FixJ family response regulator
VSPLIARGLTNAEIAGEITVVETTVKTHVTLRLSKLGFREQAAVLAYESGFVTRCAVIRATREPSGVVLSIGVLG